MIGSLVCGTSEPGVSSFAVRIAAERLDEQVARTPGHVDLPQTETRSWPDGEHRYHRRTWIDSTVR